MRQQHGWRWEKEGNREWCCCETRGTYFESCFSPAEINQEDNSEKNSQVPLVKEIYERASHVLIWLGTAPNTGLAVRQIATLYLQTHALDDTARLDEATRKLWDRRKFSRFDDARLSVCYGGYSVSWESYQGVVDFFAGSTRGGSMLLLASPSSVAPSLLRSYKCAPDGTHEEGHMRAENADALTLSCALTSNTRPSILVTRSTRYKASAVILTQ
ncbi:uncharacterized protein BDZ99DRAFT_477514 [Mytilinidion resinicola]|uniref:Heterokaryon incompatibility domain-containing protein n=1 Tax=Mytilinidion resinicola TaxID=574789 RepID=A0A6A6YJK5_9PEZI|nr:uncharacterized protein BDZ99DRAFT_477514 [Mytilinidion resinicola]KAF2809032.1 hypothetical protein BDZ99DRAFT_477514 [Mytilinidion resinicola]